MATPTTYIKSSVEVISSEDSGYQPEKYHSKITAMLDSATNYGVYDSKEQATTGGAEYYYDSYGTIEFMIFENFDSTNYVTIAYTSSAGSCTHRLKAGEWMKTPNVASTANITLTANTANLDVRIIVVTSMAEA